MVAPSGEQFRLDAYDQELVAVEVGGGIRTYRAHGADIIDGYAEQDMAAGGRGQILAPWPNRLQDGRYEWAGEDYQAALTEPEAGNAIHGLVRWAAWRLVDAGDDRLRLEHRLHPQPGWPWTVDLAVDYRLSVHGLEVHTHARNAAPDPCPFGLGWHPYLHAFGSLVDEAHLTVPALDAYQTDEKGIPTRRYSVEGTPADYRVGRLIGEAKLDTAYTGLIRDGDGRAAVTLQGPDGRRTRLWVDGHYTHLMVYTGDTLSDPARRRTGLAVEPMTCAPNMLRSGDGRLVLGSKASLRAAWGLQSFSNS